MTDAVSSKSAGTPGTSTGGPISPRVGQAEVAAVLSRALNADIFGPEDTAVAFYDVDGFLADIDALTQCFPVGTLHALAVKANPLVELLKIAAGAGMGVEVASRGELHLATAACIPPERIVFDSPAKTVLDIVDALRQPMLMNANSGIELLRIAELTSENSKARVGLRVNPNTGAGAIEHTSTATRGSKFGVPIEAARETVATYLAAGGRLDALHVHVGSQGMSVDQLVAACATTYELFQTLQTAVPTLSTFDIGGGLPVAYASSQTAPTFATYATALKQRIPDLWTGDVALVTEFGRSLHAHNGWVASKIEYLLPDGDGTGGTLVTHVGADMFVRPSYRPDVWGHEFFVASGEGEIRFGDPANFSIAGPLCFSGDYLAREAILPGDVQPGDFLIVRDAGAYTSSMWSVYNSRQLPKTVGYHGDGDLFELGSRETLDGIVGRWSV